MILCTLTNDSRSSGPTYPKSSNGIFTRDIRLSRKNVRNFSLLRPFTVSVRRFGRTVITNTKHWNVSTSGTSSIARLCCVCFPIEFSSLLLKPYSLNYVLLPFCLRYLCFSRDFRQLIALRRLHTPHMLPLRHVTTTNAPRNFLYSPKQRLRKLNARPPCPTTVPKILFWPSSSSPFVSAQFTPCSGRTTTDTRE